MNMRIVAILLVFAVLVLSGCGSSGTSLGNPYIGGSDALTMSFVSGAPPTEVYDQGNDPFTIQLDVSNIGEHDMVESEGYIQIRGISPLEYDVSDSKLRQTLPALKGATKDSDGRVVQGDREIIVFDELKYTRDIAATIDSTLIEAIACYDYSTRATGTVCVKKSNRDLAEDICTISGTKSIYNSAGPVQILSLEQKPAGQDKIQVSFTIGPSVGLTNEFFFKEGTECNTQPNNPDRYVVFVEVKSIVGGTIPAQCSGLSGGNSGYRTLPNGASIPITCTFDVSGVNTDATTQFNVELGYRYQESIRTPLTIKDLGNNVRD